MDNTTRRSFLKTSLYAAGYVGAMGMTAQSYARVIGANDRVRVGVLGYADRFKDALLPSFRKHMKELNFEIVALADLWSLRREEGAAALTKAMENPVMALRNQDELHGKDAAIDAEFVVTADFQHALLLAAAVKAGKDVYCEKPLAETMADNRLVFDTVKASDRIVQIGSQRRSGPNYQAAAEFIQSGKFGPIVAVELVWNVNQPGRWRRPKLVAKLKESDVDWKRYLMNRPMVGWDPRKYIEYRLFWPYSSGIPGQWMCHQIDTVHWFSGLPYPRSVAVNGGVYVWKDGRTNADTLTAVFDYGPEDDPASGFQVVFSSRMTNSEGGTKETYYSNGGTIDLDKGLVTPAGGLSAEAAEVMDMSPNLLTEQKISVGGAAASGATTGADPFTGAHMRNWMECVRSRKQPNAPIEAGYKHSIATIMTNAAFRTGERVHYDPKTREVIAAGKPFTGEV
jgi:predicted dehydrogenase